MKITLNITIKRISQLSLCKLLLFASFVHAKIMIHFIETMHAWDSIVKISTSIVILAKVFFQYLKFK